MADRLADKWVRFVFFHFHCYWVDSEFVYGITDLSFAKAGSHVISGDVVGILSRVRDAS